MKAVIGGGLTGLTAAIRLAEQGVGVELFEAAPELGGRTRSFMDGAVDELCDNGPHLLIGAYRATRKLLQECGASANIHWQNSLELPMWERQRGFFPFRPTPLLPLPAALLLASLQLPGHGPASTLAMLRLGRGLQAGRQSDLLSVREWLDRLHIPVELRRDLLEPLCLGAMNEASAGAPASSFCHLLQESFASHDSARLGWFSGPLSETLIAPLADRAMQLGVAIHRRRRIRTLAAEDGSVRLDGRLFDAAILALPAYAAGQLLGHDGHCATQAITNIHLWFDEHIRLPATMVGGIGTHGHWFFDVSAQMRRQHGYRHICIVISADAAGIGHTELISRLVAELRAISGHPSSLSPVHCRIVREKRATVLVRPEQRRPALPPGLVDGCERPLPGDLPATIETAIRRGELAARCCLEGAAGPFMPNSSTL